MGNNSVRFVNIAIADIFTDYSRVLGLEAVGFDANQRHDRKRDVRKLKDFHKGIKPPRGASFVLMYLGERLKGEAGYCPLSC